MKGYAILLHGNRSSCPECSGMVKRIGLSLDFRCIDCGQCFKCIGETINSPRALFYEPVFKEKTES